MKSFWKQKLLFILIILIASLFRFTGVNWDQGHHLHPDERFLTMVANAMKVPSTFYEYMNPQVSTFNPANIGYTFYVYGIFPVSTVKLLAIATDNDTYDGITFVGRITSAAIDIITVMFIFKLVMLLEEPYKFSRQVKYFAAFFYAIAVLPIQLSHFFAVDTFLNTFLLASLYFSIRFWLKNSYTSYILSAISLGLALASKISAVYMAPLIGIFLFAGLFEMQALRWWQSPRFKKQLHAKQLLLCCVMACTYALLTYYTLRLANPYMFQTPNILQPQVSNLFIENIQQLKSWEGKDVWFPPAVQWINKPATFAITNLVLFGLGIPISILSFIGIGLVFSTKKMTPLVIFALYILLYILYQSIIPIKSLRYLIFMYPLLAVFAGYAYYTLIQKRHLAIQAIVILACFIWPLSFLSIYLQPHSRVQASTWIYDNIPPGSVIAWEHWDDPLPLSFPNKYSQQYTLVELPIFTPDTPEKMEMIQSALKNADYYILSSNRGWGSIPTAPKRYPLMTKFYENLFAEQTAYTKIKKITSYPSLQYLGIPLTIKDDMAEEAFTVYDHPKVLIFKNKYR